MIGYMMEMFKKRKILETTNIVITGLHGYIEVSADKVYDISNLVNSKVGSCEHIRNKLI